MSYRPTPEHLAAMQRGRYGPASRVDRFWSRGPKFKALLVGYMPLDLFVVRPPATWGVVFGLRTGPGDWNTRLVTECKTIGRRVREGQVEVWRGSRWETVPTPDERSFFEALGQRWVEPRDRRVERVEIRRPVSA